MDALAAQAEAEPESIDDSVFSAVAAAAQSLFSSRQPVRRWLFLDSRFLLSFWLGSTLLFGLILFGFPVVSLFVNPPGLRVMARVAMSFAIAASLVSGVNLLFVLLIYQPFVRRGPRWRALGIVELCVVVGLVMGCWLLF